ncbi:MAG: (2Fe-2S)-binding protein [Planctomycetota bacterium]|nr:(2Fe-2S)-binding protein [Planctomycetota bacterium]
MSSIRVDRCLCTRQTFAKLLPAARAAGVTTSEELGRLTGAGTHCGMCRPYLCRGLKTGETYFTSLLAQGQLEAVKPDAND